MSKRNVAVLVALTLVICSSSLRGKNQDPKPKRTFGVDYQLGMFREAELRHAAITTVMPTYPDEAVAAGAQGLIDVAVMFDENGDCDCIHMQAVESPHPAITEAVREALKQWKVKIGYDYPNQQFAHPVRPFAEVRFHFVIREGVPTVEPATREEAMSTSRQFHDYSSRVGKCMVSRTIKKKSDTDRCFDPAYIARIPV
jgi:hypothetical protein